MATSVFGEEFDVEERLFMALSTGPLENYQDLLNSLGDVDEQGVKQRTLLHIAVRLGKVDWVEGLLGKGANPGLRDVDGKSIVELAQGMAEKYPEDGDRKLIHKLVCLVKIARDSERSVALGGSSNTSGCLDTRMEAMQPDTMSMLSLKITSICESIADIQRGMMTCNIQMREMANIKKSMDDFKTGMEARDVLLSALECSVTTLANKLGPVSGTSETLVIAEEVVPSAPRTEEYIRQECVDAMVRKTSILHSDEGKVLRARGLYEKLYAAGDETACILAFIKSEENVSIEIDFDSGYIGRMRTTVRDHDGVERMGNRYVSFSDFEERKVYLGGGDDDENWTVGCLASALLQMALSLAFGNGGRPYAGGDDVIRQQLESVVKEVEEYWRIGEAGLHWFIRFALLKESQLGKEIYIMSAVPAIIAKEGGMELEEQRVPSLLPFFQERVMPALLAKA